MKKITAVVAITLLAVLCRPAYAQLTKDAAIAKTEAILKNLQDGKTANVIKEFDTRMAQEVPEEKLKGGWSGVVGQFGAFKSITERREGQIKDRQAVELILAFERETVVLRAVYDAAGKVSGLVFRPLSGAMLPSPK